MSIRKWIIEGNEFKCGDQDQHRQIADNICNVECGGICYIDIENKKIYLYGKSIEYGSCVLKNVQLILFTKKYPPELTYFEWYFSKSDDLQEVLKSSKKIF